jgi:competence protein ComEA
MKLIRIVLLSVLISLPFTLLAGKVDINHANASTLAANLKGIGDKKAKAIIMYRRKHGRFKNINELLNVKGIGEKTLATNRKNILLNKKGTTRE